MTTTPDTTTTDLAAQLAAASAGATPIVVWEAAFYLDLPSDPHPCGLLAIEAANKACEAAYRLTADLDMADRDRLCRPYRRALREATASHLAREALSTVCWALIGTGGGHADPGAGTCRGREWAALTAAMLDGVLRPPSGLVRSQATGGAAWTAALRDGAYGRLQEMRWIHHIVSGLGGPQEFLPDWETEERILHSGLLEALEGRQPLDLAALAAAIARSGMIGAASADQLAVAVAAIDNTADAALRLAVERSGNSLPSTLLELLSIRAELVSARDAAAAAETDRGPATDNAGRRWEVI